jgi:hypothetical protein
MNAVIDCPGCDRPHESIHSCAQHAWKTQDDQHDFDDLDAAIVAVVEHNEGMHMTDDTTDDTTDDGNATVESDSDSGSVEPPPTTDDGNDTGGDGTAADGGGPLPQPSPADGATTPTDGEQSDSCPGCGEPLQTEGVEPGFYNCSNCGTSIVLKTCLGCGEELPIGDYGQGSYNCSNCGRPVEVEV